MSAGFARGSRRRFVSVPAGAYPAPAPPSAAPRLEDDLFARPAEPASFGDPLFDEDRMSFSPAVASAVAVRGAPPAAPRDAEPYEEFASSAFSTTEPDSPAEPAPRRAWAAGPTARGTLGILVGAAIGAIVGLILSTAMLALYAPSDFAQAIMDPVALWTEIDDWKVLAGALLIAIGFAVLGAGQGAQQRAARA